jgi:hypothetical protein
VSYLQELLSQWVQWPTTDHPSHPTVTALCTSLRSSLVGLGGLAEEVEKELKQSTGKWDLTIVVFLTSLDMIMVKPIQNNEVKCVIYSTDQRKGKRLCRLYPA